MKRSRGLLLGLLLLIGVISSAEAINIMQAEIDGGAVVVTGNQAAKNVPIEWEGVQVTTSNNGGVFKFTTSILPADCVGELSDGVSTIEVVIEDCLPAPVIEIRGGVLQTGQTACWDNFGTSISCTDTGQDGDLKKGVARSYTDNVTGLVWERLTDDGSINDKDNFYTWAGALGKIATLNTTPCFAARCDWRLPNINELQTLVVYGRVSPAIDLAFNNGTTSFTQFFGFTGFTQSFSYWSSTTCQDCAFFAVSAWMVDFNAGFVGAGVKTGGGYVRAVRGDS